MYVLVVEYEPDYMPPDIHGPFDTVEEGKAYAESLRHVVLGLPWIEATPENNEAWTEAGWYFAIVQIKKEC